MTLRPGLIPKVLEFTGDTAHLDLSTLEKVEAYHPEMAGFLNGIHEPAGSLVSCFDSSFRSACWRLSEGPATSLRVFSLTCQHPHDKLLITYHENDVGRELG